MRGFAPEEIEVRTTLKKFIYYFVKYYKQFFRFSFDLIVVRNISFETFNIRSFKIYVEKN